MSSNLKVFVHVPKTAGTSFRTAMEDSFGLEAMAFDYGPDSPKTSPLVRDLVYREDNPERLWSELQAGGVRILSGHVRAERYVRYCDPENIMVFLRDPIQRLVSEFLHFQRHNGYTKGFDDFSHDTAFIDRQLQYLTGCRLHEVGFLGITEQYEDSLRLANEQFGWNLRNLVLNTHRSDLESHYVLKGAEAQEILELNRQDIAFYTEARAELSRRLESICTSMS
ncbi:hypothetical protein COW53_02130 [bacterium CG17_big_fil_post_rev_8_21_14_2_50_64_8]|nr:MAG: hypothetical protein COW53_02130 [bacterium CG17_big_fil_post_rev_8_21_14_2_50_64_8]PJA77134.1 MAG: hypothetical protein CO151_00450 [bacterium CG_4_9_14_3_um_filter_65_15]